MSCDILREVFVAHGQSQGIEFTELPPGTSIVDVSYVLCLAMCNKMSLYVIYRRTLSHLLFSEMVSIFEAIC